MPFGFRPSVSAGFVIRLTRRTVSEPRFILPRSTCGSRAIATTGRCFGFSCTHLRHCSRMHARKSLRTSPGGYCPRKPRIHMRVPTIHGRRIAHGCPDTRDDWCARRASTPSSPGAFVFIQQAQEHTSSPSRFPCCVTNSFALPAHLRPACLATPRIWAAFRNQRRSSHRSALSTFRLSPAGRTS